MSSPAPAPTPPSRSPGVVILEGRFKKLKTLKKKYFVLKDEAPEYPACLEYYDSKKKYTRNHPPKRSISVRSCFNINRRTDTRHKYVVALYTKTDCFCLVMSNEADLKEWLKALLLLQNGDQPDGEEPRPTFEHVWQVYVQERGLAKLIEAWGPYRLCLTDRILSLIKFGAVDTSDSIDIALNCIRRSGTVEGIFFVELGRSAIAGGGDLWMEVEDKCIAENIVTVIAAASGAPKQRFRSSSANEASKPISVLQKGGSAAQKLLGFSPLEEEKTHEEQVGSLQEQNVTASAPSQCSQSQTASTTNTHTAATAGTSSGSSEPNGIMGMLLGCAKSSGSVFANIANRRRNSVASHPIPSANNNVSQSIHANTTTTTSTTTTSSLSSSNTTSTTTTTTTTKTISHERTLSLPLAANAINQTQSSKRSVLRCVSAVRDRCDSLPSRARTTSESQPCCCVVSTAALPTSSRTSHLINSVVRPHSGHLRAGMMMSYSPPVGSIPISPASGACSTDSTGSSLSMDDASETTDEGGLAKFGHSLTPDEPVIFEENADDYVPWSHSLNHQPKYHCSPSQQSSYVEMYSPCSSSPGRSAYMPMSPAQGAHSHSRASSLVEEASALADGYVPMAPVGDDGYVDMDPANNQNGHFPDDMSQHGGSSCSVTSGTPSTDMRFSEYHLDKVTSFLAPGDDLQTRPTRAYSVGSRPEPINRHRKNRLEIAQQESNRVRAFSVGSRSKKSELSRLIHVITAPLVASIESSQSNKSNSAPLLSSSWGHTSGCSTNSDRMEDLMELDFSKPTPVAPFTSPSSSYSQSQSYSTATDTSSYVDMSPGQPPISSTAPYVDMNGPTKSNRINNNGGSSSNNIINNNNNNIATANHNHNHSLFMVSSHKHVTSVLKPVEEAESSYMSMEPSLEEWQHSRISPKQVPSPCQDDYMQMNGPPGGTRTAPMDLPQPRRPPEGYVEMSFKPKPSLEQNYINMSLGLNHNNRRHHHNNRKKNSSLPIAIQAGTKFSKTPNFLPLNGSPISESLSSTPATPPRDTPTGSSATIFPFSLNSPQSPIKPFSSSSQKIVKLSSALAGNISNKNDSNASLPITNRKISAPSPLPGIDGCPSSKKAHDNPDSHTNPTARHVTLPSKLCNTVNSATTTIAAKEPLRVISNSIAKEQTHPLSPITKKLSDLTVSKPRLVTASPMTSPTPSGFKPVQLPKPTSPKIVDDTTPTATPTPTPTATPTPTPSPLDSEGYEKLQPGATLLHYASLDLPEVSGAPPVSPTPVQESFNYAEIDFAKLKQN